MPGFGMHQGMRMYQRQELRLEQILILSQLQELDTKGGVDAEEQYQRLKKISNDLDKGIYTDTPNFYERVMKRIKKEERTQDIKEIVGVLRSVIDESKPSLEQVKQIVKLGITAYEKSSTPPSVELGQACDIMRKSPFQDNEKFRVIDLGLKNYQQTKTENNLYSLLDELSKDSRTKDRDIFIQAFDRIERIVHEENDSVKYLSDVLFESLPNKIDFEVFNLGLEGLIQHNQMNGNITDVNPSKVFRNLLARNNLKEILSNYSIPLPLLAFIQSNIDDNGVLEKIANFCNDKHFQRSKDIKRTLQRGFSTLDSAKDGPEFLKHLASILENSSQLAKVFSYINLLSYTGDFSYDFTAKNFEELETRLKNNSSQRAFSLLGLSTEYKSKLLEKAQDIRPELFKIISTLSGIYSAYYSEEIPVLRSITEAIIDGRFNEWKYTNPIAAEQLALLNNQINSWKENKIDIRILGDTSGLEPRVNAVKILGAEAKQLYEQFYGKKVDKKSVEELEAIILEKEKRLREPSTLDIEKKSLGIEASELRKQYSILRSLELFVDTKLTNLESNKKLFEERSRDVKSEELRNIYTQAVSILSSKELTRLNKVTVCETDNNVDLFEVGRIPILSCQRWTEKTGHNNCLLAYVGDANKKLIQVKDSNYNIVGRSILRLTPLDEETPMLFLERPYANAWSEDYSKAVLISVLEKAALMSKEINHEVAVGTVDERYVNALKSLVKDEVKVLSYKKNITFPNSINPVEYHDSFGGNLKSGSTVKGNSVRYVLVGAD